MSGGEASGKPWKPFIRAEDRERVEAKARDLDIEFLGRDGEPMRPSDWLEAKADFDYLIVATDRVGDVLISTVWVGIHFDQPGWEKVIFGTQAIDLRPATLERLGGIGVSIGETLDLNR